MSVAADCALRDAYDEAARCCGEVLGARLFMTSNPLLAMEAMRRASENLAAAINLILLASTALHAEMERQVAAANGEDKPERCDA